MISKAEEKYVDGKDELLHLSAATKSNLTNTYPLKHKSHVYFKVEVQFKIYDL